MERVELLKTYCEHHNIRLYKKRMQVWSYLSNFGEEIDAESLWIKLRFDGHSTSRTSVYLALRWLAEKGFVALEWNHKKAFYMPEEVETIQQLIPQKI